MLTVPFFSLAVGLRKVVAGAWIGGAINNTGNVVASAALLQDQDAEEVAAIVKMVQNALIGFATVFITFFWMCVRSCLVLPLLYRGVSSAGQGTDAVAVIPVQLRGRTARSSKASTCSCS